MDFARDLPAMLADFGEPVTLEHGADRRVLTGLFNAAHAAVEFGGTTVEAPEPTVEIPTGDLQACGAAPGDRLLVRGTWMTIISIRPGDGTSLVAIREYRG